jgi:hypothetical protein
LEDLATIKRSFAATLRSMMHTRIEYPKIEEGSEKSKKKSRKSKKKTGEEKKLDSDSPKKSEDTKEEEVAAR